MPSEAHINYWTRKMRINSSGDNSLPLPQPPQKKEIKKHLGDNMINYKDKIWINILENFLN